MLLTVQCEWQKNRTYREKKPQSDQAYCKASNQNINLVSLGWGKIAVGAHFCYFPNVGYNLDDVARYQRFERKK